eukprot:scaffold22003_cov18-Tisochrysis_lutea.AAC.2
MLPPLLSKEPQGTRDAAGLEDRPKTDGDDGTEKKKAKPGHKTEQLREALQAEEAAKYPGPHSGLGLRMEQIPEERIGKKEYMTRPAAWGSGPTFKYVY